MSNFPLVFGHRKKLSEKRANFGLFRPFFGQTSQIWAIISLWHPYKLYISGIYRERARIRIIAKELGSFKSEVIYYEWVGERRWDIHMKNNLVFKLPENNLSRGVELMLFFLNGMNKYLKPIVSVDLRNLDKPIIKFRKSPSVEYTHEEIKRFAGWGSCCRVRGN